MVLYISSGICSHLLDPQSAILTSRLQARWVIYRHCELSFWELLVFYGRVCGIDKLSKELDRYSQPRATVKGWCVVIQNTHTIKSCGRRLKAPTRTKKHPVSKGALLLCVRLKTQKDSSVCPEVGSQPGEADEPVSMIDVWKRH